MRVLCSDGHSDSVSVLVPSACRCLQCGANQHLQPAQDLRQQQEEAGVVGDAKTDNNMDVNFAPRKGQVSIEDIFGDGNE